MRSPLFLLGAVAGACASQTPEVPAAKLAQEEEIKGFRTAVVDVCLASAMAGTPVAELATETGPIVPADSSTGGVGDTFWAPREAEGVLIKANLQECQVTATGPTTSAAFTAVEEALSDPHGFVVETPGAPRGGNVYKRYSKKVGEQTFRVTLADPGAMTPAGTLVATVTATPRG